MLESHKIFTQISEGSWVFMQSKAFITFIPSGHERIHEVYLLFLKFPPALGESSFDHSLNSMAKF